MTTFELLACPDESTRLAAVQALAENNVGESVTWLVRALDDASWRVRQAAVPALVDHRKASAIGAALRAMHADHNNLNVVNSVIQVLIRSGIDSLATLTHFLGDPDAELRTCAA